MKAWGLLPDGPREFTAPSIARIRERCGVYVLCNEEGCVLAGCSKNLRMSLTRHLEQPSDCLKQHWPTSVEMRPCRAFEIESRWASLLLTLENRQMEPLCGSGS